MSSKLKFRLALVLCCVMMMSIFAGCGGSESAPDDSGSQGEVIKLGFLGALTGSVANYGIPGKRVWKWLSRKSMPVVAYWAIR